MTQPAMGWYPDPNLPGMLRWWDGRQWTPHSRAVAMTPPATVAPPIPATPPVATAPTGAAGAARTTQEAVRHGEKVRITEFPVEVNEIALSLRGWEIVDARARITSQSLWTDQWEHNLHLSGTAVFNEAEVTDQFSFSEEDVAPVLGLFRAPGVSEHFLSFQPFYCDDRGDATRPIRFTSTENIGVSGRDLDHETVTVELTSVDAYKDGNYYLPYQPIAVPYEIVDETSNPEFTLDVDHVTVLLYGDADSPQEHGVVQAQGRVRAADRATLAEEHVRSYGYKPELPFQVFAPDVVIDFYDATGFLLGKEEIDLTLSISVSATGETQSRVANWLIDEGFLPEQFSGEVSRAVFRVVDA